MNILQVSTADIGGGAEKIAWNLLEYYRAHGHQSWMAVGYKRSSDPGVFQFANSSLWLRRLRRAPDILRGFESFRFPGSAKVLQLPPSRPDVLHCHNLHGAFFDLRLLPRLSSETPLVMTLHDAWLTTGHCAHSLGCDRWLTGCGHCPDLTIYPGLWRDGTAANWRRKRQIYSNSRLWIASPSQWLLDRAQQSMLREGAVEMRVIPNGINLRVFSPGDRARAREKLGLPVDADILVFSAVRKGTEVWRDYTTIQNALRQLSTTPRKRRLVCVALGQEAQSQEFANVQVRHLPFVRDTAVLADYYRASNIYLHASLADTFPNTVLEAEACGTPVIATGVGGIPEQIEEGVTGFVTPPRDDQAMAAAIRQVLQNDFLQTQMSAAGGARARRLYDMDKQAQTYLDWYEEIIENFHTEKRHAVPTH